MDPPQKNKDFLKYPSIENTYNYKFTSKVKGSQVGQSEVVWAALEKIHGANFSIECTSNTAIYCRRNDYISKPIPIPCQDVTPYFMEKFFSCQKLVSKFHNKLAELHVLLQARYPKLAKYFVYGEYFGGFWPNRINLELPHVQQGVCYSPDHHFFVFDCLLKSEDNQEWLSVADVIQIVGKVLPVIPVLKKGTFEELLGMDCVINSTIPNLLGLELAEKNICEGIVIRPYESSGHLMMKKKNDQFLQIVNVARPVKQKLKAIAASESEQLVSGLLKYSNKNRVASAYSKMPDATIPQLAKEVLRDILEEASKNDLVPLQDPELVKKLQKGLSGPVFKEVVSYLKMISQEPQSKVKEQAGDSSQKQEDTVK